MNARDIYTRFQLCERLERTQRCFRCWSRQADAVTEDYHEHIPVRRMSRDVAAEALRALVAISEKWEPGFVLGSLMNHAAKTPEVFPGFLMRHEFVEEGVRRIYCSSGDHWAWYDEVIDRNAFRARGAQP